MNSIFKILKKNYNASKFNNLFKEEINKTNKKKINCLTSVIILVLRLLNTNLYRNLEQHTMTLNQPYKNVL